MDYSLAFSPLAQNPYYHQAYAPNYAMPAYQDPYAQLANTPYAFNGGLASQPLTQFNLSPTAQFANLQSPNTQALNPYANQAGQIGSLTSQMPGFNQIPVTQGVAQPPSSPLPAFDYGGLNQINNAMPFANMPYVTQVPQQGFLNLGNGQTVSSTQYTAYIPSVVPGSITNLQQLSSLPLASPGSLGAILQLAGIPPSVIGASALNNTGSLIPPVYGLKV
jgi:hypothetical protein